MSSKYDWRFVPTATAITIEPHSRLRSLHSTAKANYRAHENMFRAPLKFLLLVAAGFTISISQTTGNNVLVTGVSLLYLSFAIGSSTNIP